MSQQHCLYHALIGKSLFLPYRNCLRFDSPSQNAHAYYGETTLYINNTAPNIRNITNHGINSKIVSVEFSHSNCTVLSQISMLLQHTPAMTTYYAYLYSIPKLNYPAITYSSYVQLNDSVE
jgi:hypothetical protein